MVEMTQSNSSSRYSGLSEACDCDTVLSKYLAFKHLLLRFKHQYMKRNNTFFCLSNGVIYFMIRLNITRQIGLQHYPNHHIHFQFRANSPSTFLNIIWKPLELQKKAWYNRNQENNLFIYDFCSFCLLWNHKSAWSTYSKLPTCYSDTLSLSETCFF